MFCHFLSLFLPLVCMNTCVCLFIHLCLCMNFYRSLSLFTQMQIIYSSMENGLFFYSIRFFICSTQVFVFISFRLTDIRNEFFVPKFHAERHKNGRERKNTWKKRHNMYIIISWWFRFHFLYLYIFFYLILFQFHRFQCVFVCVCFSCRKIK